MLPVNFPSKVVVAHWWARKKLEGTINWKNEEGKIQERVPIDYKLDLAGCGVWFIVGKHGRGVTAANMTEWEEVYKIIPVWARPGTRVPEDVHNLDGHTGRFAREHPKTKGEVA